MLIKKFTAALVSAVLLTAPQSFSIASGDMCAVSAASQEVNFDSFDMNVNGGDTIRGVDVSSIISVENSGVKFYNEAGEEQDIFRTLAENGVNYIRVRVWNEPNDGNGSSYGGGNNDVKIAGEIGKRAAKYNMKLLVDIQYSDFWADPAKQTRPKYWQPHDHDKLKGEIYKWTSWVLESITKDGGNIGMVQVGNETNCFFCGEKDMTKICDLFSSGNKAVRDFDKNILIAHHFANPSNVDHYKWYAEIMNKCNLDYDVFATSYYPYWHGSMQNMTDVLKFIGDTYGKYVMVAETAYPHTDEDGDDFGNTVTSASPNCDFKYPVSDDGQEQCLTDVFQAVANTGKWGIGVFYWEPAWLGEQGISPDERFHKWEEYGSGWATATAKEYDKDVDGTGGSSFDNQALFDYSGKPLKALKVFGRVTPKKENPIPEKGKKIEAGLYRIKNVNSGKYLTVANGEGRDGSNVVQYEADGRADYNTWSVREAEDGYYEIFSSLDADHGLRLGIDGGKQDDRTNIGIYSDKNSDAQKFKFIEDKDGGLVIVTRSSGDRSALEIADGEGKNGGNAQQFKRNGEKCQTWVLEPVEPYVIMGDANGDGGVDVFDMVLMRRNVIERKFFPVCDVNGDETMSVADLVRMEMFLLQNEPFLKDNYGTPINTVFPEINENT